MSVFSGEKVKGEAGRDYRCCGMNKNPLLVGDKGLHEREKWGSQELGEEEGK